MTAIVQKAVSTTGSYVEIYQVPASGVQYVTGTLTVLNRHTSVAKLKVALAQTGTPGNADMFEDGAEIPANGGKYEYECMILAPGEKVLIQSDNPNCSIRFHGLVKVA